MYRPHLQGQLARSLAASTHNLDAVLIPDEAARLTLNMIRSPMNKLFFQMTL